MDLHALLRPGTLAMLIPLMWPIWLIVSSVAQHRERMAMIERGIDPDAAKRVAKERLAMIEKGMNPDAVTARDVASELSQPRR